MHFYFKPGFHWEQNESILIGFSNNTVLYWRYKKTANQKSDPNKTIFGAV